MNRTSRCKPTEFRRTALLAAALLTAVMLAGCASDLADDGRVDESIGNSVSGAYLAGRFARGQNDTAAAADYFVAALAREPGDANLMQRAFFALLSDGRVGEAIALGDRVAKANPRSGTANLLLAVEHVRLGQFDAALERLAAAQNADQVGLLRPLTLAWTLAGKGDTEGALRALGQLADRGQLAGFRNFHAGLINEMGGRIADAEAALRALVGGPGGSGSLRAVEALGTLLERNGRHAEAESVYRGFLLRFPENVVAQNLTDRAAAKGVPAPLARDAAEGVAEAFYHTASAFAAENVRETPEIYANIALHLRPDFPTARMLIAEIRESQERWADARNHYRRIDPKSPFGWIARLREAQTLDRDNRVDEAAAILRAMIDEQPARSDAASALGDVLRGRERWPDAAGAYDIAIGRIADPKERHWTLFYARGVARERAKEWPKAEADFLKALEMRPDQPSVLNYLGYSWIEQGLHLARARRMIERAVEQRPQDGAIVDSLGWVLFRLGRYEEAVIQLERAVELRPGDATINDHLGDIYWVVGRREEAVFQWERALTLEPEPDLVSRVKKKIESGFDPPTPHAEVGG